MYHQIKYLGLALIMLLGLYPIIELTRVIIVSGNIYFPEMTGQFAAEIAIMWTLYLAIVPVYLFINSRLRERYSEKTGEALPQSGKKKNYNQPLKDKDEYIRVNYMGEQER